MLAQAAGLAVLAAISPAALVACAVLLGSPSPRRTGVIFLVGAIAVTTISSAIVFAALRAGHLQQTHQRPARDGLRLGLGILMLLAAIALLYRKRRRANQPGQHGQRAPQGQSGGFTGRLLARPGGRTAFLLGSILYAPSLTLVAAVQVVATSQLSVLASIAVLVLVIAITVVGVWLPLVCYLIWPDRTGQTLARFNGWLRRNGPVLLVAALAIGGLYLTINGASGLALVPSGGEPDWRKPVSKGQSRLIALACG
jgi:Sap, sulfolipid-1-addressing protein